MKILHFNHATEPERPEYIVLRDDDSEDDSDHAKPGYLPLDYCLTSER